MYKLAPLTKLILTAAVSFWAVLLDDPVSLAVLAGMQLLITVLCRFSLKIYKGIASLFIFAFLLAIIQYFLGGGLHAAVVTGLRMLAMTLVFVLVLSTTRIQDLTTALVQQCHIPYEYSFMFTSALRFIPDFLAESKAVQEAQACRGYTPNGNLIKRFIGYIAIVGPLVLRAISRSETMAMSLELRGFGSKNRSFSSRVSLVVRDYFAIAGMGLVSLGIVISRIGLLSWGMF